MIIKEDLQLHSDFSDGKNSIEEMARAAICIGLTKIAFTDHVRKTTKWLDQYVKEIKRVQKKYPQIKIISGIEAKVIDKQGNIDAQKNFFSKVDLVLGAFHRIPKGKNFFWESKEIQKHKKRVLKDWYKAKIALLRNKNVHIIAHPTALIKKFGIKIPKQMKNNIAHYAKKYHKTIEINSKYKVPDREFLSILRRVNVALSHGSDSHSVKELKINHSN